MPVELQWLIYLGTGILMYLFVWRKKIIEHISFIISYVGAGFLFHGMDKEKNLYEYIGLTIIIISMIVAIIQVRFQQKK